MTLNVFGGTLNLALSIYWDMIPQPVFIEAPCINSLTLDAQHQQIIDKVHFPQFSINNNRSHYFNGKY